MQKIFWINFCIEISYLLQSLATAYCLGKVTLLRDKIFLYLLCFLSTPKTVRNTKKKCQV